MLIPLLLSFIFTAFDGSAAETPKEPKEEKRRFVQNTRMDISAGEKALTFGAVYVAQWASYVVMQNEAIRTKGSFENWRKYPFQPHFDRDGIGFNVFQHSLSGSLYYQFFRSRGYSRKNAVIWAVVSSTAFEFTIETITEPPSYQDLYQTPILGSILGMGLESASLFFHSKGTWPARVVGYLLNPFSLLPGANYSFRAAPMVNKHGVGANLAWEF
jgi:hypothetical protein